MATKFVTVTVAERLATVTLNNPPSNLLSTPVLKELDQTFGQLEADDAVRVIILTASGKFFSPGADIKELADLNTMHQGSELSGRGQALLNRIERFDKPVIAAINGACLGGGLELAMACHMRVAAAGTLLGLPEIKLGLIPGFGGTQRLPRIIGPSKAAELILTGETIKSEEALTWGLVNRVVPPEEVLLTAQKLAGMITAKGRLATHAALQAIRTVLHSSLAGGLAHEAEMTGQRCETRARSEATTAVVDKRQRRYSHRTGDAMVEAVRPRPARHWHAGNGRLPGAGTSQDRRGLASPARGGAVRIGRAEERRAVHRTGRGRLSPEAVPEGVAERAGQCVPREEAVAGPGAVLRQEATRGAGEVGAPAAQHPAETHSRAVEAG